VNRPRLWGSTIVGFGNIDRDVLRQLIDRSARVRGGVERRSRLSD
jgi:hypothetical protein